jgi:hypothetical protein
MQDRGEIHFDRPKKANKNCDDLVQELYEVVKLDFDLLNGIENGIQSEHQEGILMQQLSTMPMISNSNKLWCCLCHQKACATIGCGEKKYT